MEITYDKSSFENLHMIYWFWVLYRWISCEVMRHQGTLGLCRFIQEYVEFLSTAAGLFKKRSGRM